MKKVELTRILNIVKDQKTFKFREFQDFYHYHPLLTPKLINLKFYYAGGKIDFSYEKLTTNCILMRVNQSTGVLENVKSQTKDHTNFQKMRQCFIKSDQFLSYYKKKLTVFSKISLKTSLLAHLLSLKIFVTFKSIKSRQQRKNCLNILLILILWGGKLSSILYVERKKMAKFYIMN